MRIIAGKWRGRKIESPREVTRPILDRAKTVLFDLLGHLLAEPGRLPPVAVLDLFAGSGALGLEALSRGARFCLMIERSRSSAAVARRNLDHLPIVHEAQVVTGDAVTCEFPPPPVTEGLPPQYELVFVDPPYRELEGPEPSAGVRMLLGRLAREAVIAPSAVIVTRHPFRAGFDGPDLSPLVDLKRRDIGGMTLRLLVRPDRPETIDEDAT